MRSFIFAVIAIVAGAGLGMFSALHMSGQFSSDAGQFADVNVGDWRSDWAIGAPAAGPYLRARIARHGLLALAKEEAVYFTRARDEAGRHLVESCTYELTGGAQQALWWSITLYDGNSRLPMNEDEALSIDATDVRASPDAWRVIIAPNRPDSDVLWISSRNAGSFDLTLRLYRPSAGLLETPESVVNPPQITRLSCDEEAGS